MLQAAPHGIHHFKRILNFGEGQGFRQGVSPWDEPCMIVAKKYCERCNRWF
jgi:hypothetical protein